MSEKLTHEEACATIAAAHPAVVAVVQQIDELDAIVRKVQQAGKKAEQSASNEHMIANALRSTLIRVCEAVSEDATRIMVAMANRKW